LADAGVAEPHKSEAPASAIAATPLSSTNFMPDFF
jgi:hypothetical protein